MSSDESRRPLRSRRWFGDRTNPNLTAMYLSNYLNYGVTLEELHGGRPIIGIAQTGSDLAPCNRHHLDLAKRVRDGIRDAGGIPMEFPVHPIQEAGRRPTASLDRNLAYLGLVEILHGYPIDGVVLTTGCDKTTPASLMAAATVNIPAIVLSGGPKLDGWWEGRLAGSGAVVWESRRRHAAGEIGFDEMVMMISSGEPSIGHCNTMGTALSMNALAEALGMSLPGCAAIPASYRERSWMAYETGRRIVGMVAENLRPCEVMTKAAFENAVVVAAALGGSSNCPPHMIAIARAMGVDHTLEDWQRLGPDIPLLVDCQPAGRFLGERFYRAGGVPAVLRELHEAGKIRGDVRTVTGRTLADELAMVREPDREVIRPYGEPLAMNSGQIVLRGNFFDRAVMKTSVISPEFRQQYLCDPDRPDCFEANAVVFEGPEDYHLRIDDPALAIDEHSILIIRYCGPVGYPGAAEVVNMQPPAAMIRRGVRTLPTLGDGRQSGTSDAPSILNVSPEAAVGGGIALLRTGDRLRVDLASRRVDVLLAAEELDARRAGWHPPEIVNQTPWQEISRRYVGQLADGGCLETEGRFVDVIETFGEARHNH